MRRTPSWPVIFGVCMFVLLAASRASGAIPGGASSIESEVATSDVVVVGRIVSVETVASPSAKVSSLWPWTKVTADVEEVIAGKAGARVVFWMEGAGGGEDSWPQSRMLLCLQDGARYRFRRGKHDPLYDAVDFVGGGWSLEEGRVGLIPSARRSPFHSAAEVLAAVRPYGKRPLRVDLTDIEGLAVPVDATEERYAEEWARRGTPEDDWAAVVVLKERRTPASSVALRALAMRASEEPQEVVMRAVAASALAARGEVAPIWRSKRDGWGMLGDWSWWVSAGIAVGIAEVVRRRTTGGVWRKGCAMTWGAAMGIVLALWLHSYFGGDALAIGHWKAGFVKGELTVVWVDRGDVTVWPMLDYERPSQVQFATAGVVWEPWYGMRLGVSGDIDFPATDCPYWEKKIALEMPCWALAGLLSLPMWPWQVVAWWREQRRRRRRGFAVLPASDRGTVQGES